jgi:hypothetical protein
VQSTPIKLNYSVYNVLRGGDKRGRKVIYATSEALPEALPEVPDRHTVPVI